VLVNIYLTDLWRPYICIDIQIDRSIPRTHTNRESMCGCVCLCLCLRGREARTNERERERERERDGGVLYPLLRTVREDIDTAYTRKSRMYVCMCAFLFERQTERDHANEWVKGRERDRGVTSLLWIQWKFLVSWICGESVCVCVCVCVCESARARARPQPLF
jgi:hypothetical protein